MKKIVTLGLGVLALGMSSQGAFAQREAATRQERRAQRVQETANMTPEQRAQYMQQRWQERMKNATPEQQAQMQQRMQQMQEQAKAQGLDPNDPTALMQLMQRGGRGGNGGNGGAVDPAAKEAQRRQMMNAAGITDKGTQDDILAFITSEEKAREPLLQLARAAAAALAPATATATVQNVAETAPATPAAPNPAAEAKVSSAFDAYTKALEADKARHEKALEALDASIGYKNTPRLKSFLTLVGIIDNDALALGGVPAIFNSPRQGGRGGNGARQTRGNRGGNAAPATETAVQAQ